MRRRIGLAIAITMLLAAGYLHGGEKATSVADARAAVKANLKSPEGKAFDEQVGKEFGQMYAETMAKCVERASKDDLEAFQILIKLGEDGSVQEVLLAPETKVASCVREKLVKDKFSPPPRPAYWVNINMTFRD